MRNLAFCCFLTLVVISSVDAFSQASFRQWSEWINSPGTKWCQNRHNTEQSYCCGLADGGAHCSTSSDTICSDDSSLQKSAEYLLCPSSIQEWATRIETIKDIDSEENLYLITLQKEEVCWFKSDLSQYRSKFMAIDVSKYSEFSSSNSVSKSQVRISGSLGCISLSKFLKFLNILIFLLIMWYSEDEGPPPWDLPWQPGLRL